MTLDEAWAEAEAALPKGWRMADVATRFTTWVHQGELVWVVDLTKQVAFGRAGGSRYWRTSAEGPTPAAALHALAVALRTREGEAG